MKRKRGFSALIFIIFIIFILIFWELAPQAGFVSPIVLPPFHEVALIFPSFICRPDFPPNFIITLLAVLASVIIGDLLGLCVGFLLASKRYLNEALHPYILLLFSTPKIMFIYFFVALFGISFTQKVAFGAFHAFFPMVLSSYAAVRFVDQNLILLARFYKLSYLRFLYIIVIPYSLLVLYAGFRTSVALALVGVILAEMYMGKEGLGSYLNVFAIALKVPERYANIVIITLISVAIIELLAILERRLSRWRGV